MQNYALFLKDFDSILKNLFETHKNYLKCKKGCSYCCEKGDYPVSQLEFAYLTEGFLNLQTDLKSIVQKNIKNIKKEKLRSKSEKFEYRCPFLINGECCVYEFRPVICRTFGVCYYDENNDYVRLPDCVNFGLNYSEFYDKNTKILNIADVPKINLRIDRVLSGEAAQKYNLDYGEIRPMISWMS